MNREGIYRAVDDIYDHADDFMNRLYEEDHISGTECSEIRNLWATHGTDIRMACQLFKESIVKKYGKDENPTDYVFDYEDELELGEDT